ncbi:MAG: UDP-N-acetylglucosamine 2-epimerase [Chlorobi bacterium OLB7]|nr:MAG: UDP-N-acetylglucosamine 2-epimerase [Chlorobi bacterium OLB7]
MTIISVVGARPNFMKAAPVKHAFDRVDGVRHLLVHTGQHYDPNMSDVFFNDLGMGKPDLFLGVGSGSHAEQTARVMVEFEKVCIAERPAIVIVYGDVNSTMAAAIVAKNSISRWLTSSQACGVLTGGCRRRSTGLSPTPSPISSLSPRRAVARTFCLMAFVPSKFIWWGTP